MDRSFGPDASFDPIYFSLERPHSLNTFETTPKFQNRFSLIINLLETDSVLLLQSRVSYKNMQVGGKLIGTQPAHSQSPTSGRLPRLIAETSPLHDFTSSSQTSLADGMVGFRDILRAKELYMRCLNRERISTVSPWRFRTHDCATSLAYQGRCNNSR